MHTALPLDSAALLAAAGNAAVSGGPTVLVDTPELFVGMKTYEPGEVFGNHFHEGYDEFFATLEGTITVWHGRSSHVELTVGTTLLCRRGSHHYLANTTDRPARLLFAKIPMVQDDTVWVDWNPPH